MRPSMFFALSWAAIAFAVAMRAKEMQQRGGRENTRMMQHFPLLGEYTLESGKRVPVPYHNYDSDALLIHGLMDPQAVENVLQGPFKPVLMEGKAIASLWVVDYKDTSIGPYQELVVTFLVTDRPDLVDSGCAALHCINALAERPHFHQYVWKLWLDQDVPIEYGRELLGCDKYKSEMEITRDGDRVHFWFKDERGRALAAGSVQVDEGPFAQAPHLASLVREAGVLNMSFYLANPPPFARWSAVTPAGVRKAAGTENQVPMWGALFASDPKFAYVDPGVSRIEVSTEGLLGPFKFEPKLVQADRNLSAILLSPWGYANRDTAPAANV